MLRIVVLRCPTLYLRWTASGTCCATLLQRCKQAAWRHLEAANCHVFRYRWKTLDRGLATLASVWQRLDNAVQRWGKYNIAWSRCTTLCCVAQLMATLYHRWRTLDSLCATLLQRCKKAAQRHLLCGQLAWFWLCLWYTSTMKNFKLLRPLFREMIENSNTTWIHFIKYCETRV